MRGVCDLCVNKCVTAASTKAVGIRFAEENAAADAHSHVHFDEKLHDSVVMVIPESDGNFLVKVSLESVVLLYINAYIHTRASLGAYINHAFM